MAKFPSQNKLMYVQDTSISNDLWSVASSGGEAGSLNLPKDLSLLNRRGYASTTRKGVPLIYRCKVDLFATGFDGTGASAAVGSDFVTTLRAAGCQNNWVMRNAAVKFHAARDEMWKKAGVKKKHLGAYAREIRYNFESHNDNWILPIDGDGAAFTEATWDVTNLRTETDTGGFYLKLVGSGIDETAGGTATAINIAHSYLASRAHVAADTNLESSETPTQYSVLNELLRPVATSATDFNIISESQDQGDNPPYEIDIDNVDSNITEPVELGRCMVGPGAQYSSMIIDIPFGLAKLYLTHYDAADTATNHIVKWDVEVLDIYEMQG